MAKANRARRAAPPRAAPSTRAYMERKLACVEQKRLHPPSAEVLARVLAEMQCDDEEIRAEAVRQVCPCRVPWEVFAQVRPAVKRLQHDPSPLVRAQAQHVEEDARELATLEALHDWLEEHDEGIGAMANRSTRRGRRRRLHQQWHAADEV